MSEIWGSVFEAIGFVVVAGTALSTLVYQVFKHLAAKWLDARFASSLQSMRHEQNKEIERLKSTLTREFDRTSKLHQREFDVLPEVWAKVSDSFWATRSLVSPLQTYPDLDRMQPSQLAEFIEGCGLAAWQKEQLLVATKKTDYYREQWYWHRAHSAKLSLREATTTLSKHGIFILPELKTRLEELLDLTWRTISEDEVNQQHRPVPRLSTSTEKFNGAGEGMLKDLENHIQGRLYATD